MLDRELLVVSALALVLSASTGAQAPAYTITNVGDGQNGDAVSVAGLSDTGFVTGWVIPPSGSPLGNIGFRWSASDTFVPSAPAGLTWKGFNAMDVNDAGTFVGFFGTSATNVLLRGYCCKNGVTKELSTPLGLYAFPLAINDEGWIVGQGNTAFNSVGAILWSPDLVPSYVARLSAAMDINKHGQIVGIHIDDDYVTTAYLVEGDVVTPLGSLDPSGKGSVVPLAINDKGEVVGSSEIDYVKHAFYWTAATGMQELPGLGFTGFPPDSAALDIDDSGVIVGYALGSSGQTSVLWRPDHSVVEFKSLCPDVGPGKNWQSWVRASRINAAGQLTGYSPHKPSGLQTRTVLLTPAALTAKPSPAGASSALEISGARPGQPVFLAIGAEDPFDRGYTLVPGCKPIGIAMEAPHVIASAIADPAGHATLGWSAPSGLSGTALRLQAFQQQACMVSNVVHVTL